MNIKAFEEYLIEQSSLDKFSGTVLVSSKNQIVFEYVSGLANKGFGIANNLETKFNIGSLGKMFTCVAVAQLVEQGKLSFDGFVGQYIPDYPNKEVAEKVTLHHLLTHTSGMGTIFNRKFAESRWKLRTLESLMPLFADDPLFFEPGSKWSYSNSAFVLLGRIIEVVSGENYIDYVKKHIFDVSQMNATDYCELDIDVSNLAVGYTYRKPYSTESDFKSPRRNNLLELPVKGFSGGGEYSNVHDMFKFERALIGNKLLSELMTKNILSFKAETARPNLNYGYSFYILNMDGHTIVGREGGYAGVSSVFHMYQDVPYTLIVLSNYDDPAAKDVAMKFSKLIAE